MGEICSSEIGQGLRYKNRTYPEIPARSGMVWEIQGKNAKINQISVKVWGVEKYHL